MPDLYHPSKKSLAELLQSEPPISVPEYQRNFSWTLKEVETFFSDLVQFSAHYPGEAYLTQEYFLGSVVLVSSSRGPERVILDGQQRLATTAILLSAIRDALPSTHRAQADSLGRDFLKWVDPFNSSNWRYRLKLNDVDSPFFERMILDPRGAPPVAPQGQSHWRIKKAREYFDEQIAKMMRSARSEEEGSREIFRLGSILTRHFSVVAVTSSDEDNAAEVFETLNDRGLSLSTADLLQNLVLRQTEREQRSRTKQLWAQMLEAASPKREKPELFIRHFWTSHHGDVKSKSLYRVIKEDFQARRVDGLAFAEELRNEARAYSEIVRGNVPDEGLKRLYKDAIDIAGTSSALTPALLSARSADPIVARTALSALLALYVRHTVIARRENNDLENVAYKVAKFLRSAGGLEKALQEILTLWPSDEDFRQAFRTASLTRRAHQRYVLTALELDSRGTAELEVARTITIEHIYPRRPDFAPWPSHADWVNRIGNLSLLDKRLNSQARNGEFQRKVNSYASSEILLSKALQAFRSWDSSAVEQRQDELAAQAVRIWSFPSRGSSDAADVFSSAGQAGLAASSL